MQNTIYATHIEINTQPCDTPHDDSLRQTNGGVLLCVLKQIIGQRSRSQSRQPLSDGAWRLIRAAPRPVTRPIRCLILDGWRFGVAAGAIRGLASAVMNYSPSMLASVPVVGTVKTESRGFDWQSLWSHNSHAVYDQRLSEGGRTAALLTHTLPLSADSLQLIFHPSLTPHLNLLTLLVQLQKYLLNIHFGNERCNCQRHGLDVPAVAFFLDCLAALSFVSGYQASNARQSYTVSAPSSSNYKADKNISPGWLWQGSSCWGFLLRFYLTCE